MRRLASILSITALIVILSVAVKANAQITDERDIPKGYTPIYTIEDLYGINNDLRGNYILMADIDMSETAEGGDWDFGYGWRPIGYEREAYDNVETFSGIIDGNGHRITNLCFYGSLPYRFIGLIAESYGTIKNLALENISISILSDSKTLYCGGIVAMQYGEISSCYVTGSINVIENPNAASYLREWNGYIGGVAGTDNFYGYYVNDCYTAVDIYGNQAGGVIGYFNHNTGAQSCYAIGKVTGEKAGPISYNGTNKNCYYLKEKGKEETTTGLSGAQMKLVKCFVGFDFDDIWFLDKNSPYPYPQLRECPQVRIESVTMKALPKKTIYGLKEDLDVAGAMITINYEDDYSVDVPLDKSMCSYKMSKGTQIVTVDYYGVKTTFEITVGTEKEILTVKSSTTEMAVGDSFTFKAEFNGTDSIEYSSSNSKVLSINKKSGVAKAVKAGTVTVTIAAGSQEKSIEVKVTKSADGKNEKGEAENEDSEPDFEVEVGESFKLPIKKATSRTITSSDKAVVSVTKKGKVTAIAPGTATITVKDKNGRKLIDTFVIFVLGEEEPDFEIEVGETMRLVLKKGYSAESSNNEYATVSDKGVITGVKAGTATIAVYNQNGKQIEKYTVEVTE